MNLNREPALILAAIQALSLATGVVIRSKVTPVP